MATRAWGYGGSFPRVEEWAELADDGFDERAGLKSTLREHGTFVASVTGEKVIRAEEEAPVILR
jgi:hypothetical protein